MVAKINSTYIAQAKNVCFHSLSVHLFSSAFPELNFYFVLFIDFLDFGFKGNRHIFYTSFRSFQAAAFILKKWNHFVKNRN